MTSVIHESEPSDIHTWQASKVSLLYKWRTGVVQIHQLLVESIGHMTWLVHVRIFHQTKAKQLGKACEQEPKQAKETAGLEHRDLPDGGRSDLRRADF